MRGPEHGSLCAWPALPFDGRRKGDRAVFNPTEKSGAAEENRGCAKILSDPLHTAPKLPPSAHGRFRRAPKLWNVGTSAGAAVIAKACVRRKKCRVISRPAGSVFEVSAPAIVSRGGPSRVRRTGGQDAKRTIVCIARGERNRGVWVSSETSNALNRLAAMELRTLGA